MLRVDDSHGLYSDFVLKVLMKIGAAYKSAERRFIVETWPARNVRSDEGGERRFCLPFANLIAEWRFWPLQGLSRRSAGD